jgi:hypothetical protein
MVLNLKHYGPLIIAIALLWLILTLFLNASLSKNQGNLIYALDDAYIHTAMAKNVSQHGVWGVTKDRFTSSSSSLLWTLLLSALYFIFGVNASMPFVLNFFIAALVLLLIFFILKKCKFTFWRLTMILTAFIIFIPLPYLVFGGLEHVLQILINLAYVYTASLVIHMNDDTPTREKDKDARLHRVFLFLLSPLVVLIRYEGLFIIFAVCLLLIARKKYFFSFLNGVTGLFPLVVYGVISVINGWYFFPNSVLLKGQRPDISRLKGILEFIYSGLRQVVYNVHLLVLVISVLALLWFLYKKHNRLWVLPNTMGMLFVIVLTCHMFFAKSGYFLNRYPQIRYDAYLAAMGLLAICFAMAYLRNEKTGKTKKNVPEKGLITLLVFFLILPLAERGVRTTLKVIRATSNIYGQQYQVGLFLKKYYPNQVVAVNDIGAVCFLADIHCFDVWGLVTREIGDLKLNKNFTPGKIAKVTQQSGAGIAVVYDQFIRLAEFEGNRPKNWIKVGQWRIPHNVACARDTVSFFALKESEAPRLIQNLREFVPQLPPEVIKEGIFIKRL